MRLRSAVFFLAIFAMGLGSRAQANDTALSLLTQWQETTNEYLSEGSVHYYIFFDSLEWRDRKEHTQRCRYARNYTKTSVDDVAAQINSLLIEASQELHAGTIAPEDYGFEYVLRFFKEHEGKRLTTCSEKSYPPYSDGQKLTFVQVEGKLRFYFGWGLPD